MRFSEGLAIADPRYGKGVNAGSGHANVAVSLQGEGKTLMELRGTIFITTGGRLKTQSSPSGSSPGG